MGKWKGKRRVRGRKGEKYTIPDTMLQNFVTKYNNIKSSGSNVIVMALRNFIY